MSPLAWIMVSILAAAPDGDDPIVIGPALEASPPRARLFSRWTVHLRNHLDDEPAERRLTLGTTVALGLGWTPADSWELALETRLRHRLDALDGGPDAEDDEVRGDFVAEVRRASVRWQLDCRELALGMDVVRWGRTLTRPTDRVSPDDWREGPLPPEGDDRVPTFVLSLRQPLGDGEARVIWSPFFTPARYSSESAEPGISANIVDSSALVTRLTQRAGGLDLALVWLWAHDRAPALPPTSPPRSAPGRQHTLGLELALATPLLGIAAEAALSLEERLFDRELEARPHTLVRWAAQVGLRLAPILDLALELEGAHAPTSNAPTWHHGPDDLWLRSRLTLLLAFDGIVRLDASTRIGLLRDDWWVTAGLSLRLTSEVGVSSGVAFFGGDPLDLGLGALYERSDHAWLRLTYSP